MATIILITTATVVRYCHKCLKHCLLSFVLGAVSPAVVVPSMLLLQEGGYGVEKGIPTLLMAAGSFDDILAITGFNTCLGMAFSTGTPIHSQRAVPSCSKDIGYDVMSMASLLDKGILEKVTSRELVPFLRQDQ